MHEGKNENFEELRNKTMQIFHDENANTDGSSGRKIYSYCKRAASALSTAAKKGKNISGAV